MAISMLLSQKVEVFAQALDANGVQVNFTAPPVFTLSDPTIGALVAISPTDPQPVTGQFGMWMVPTIAGNVTVSVTEDAVLGDDTTKLTGTLDFVIAAAPADLATSIAVSAGAPVAKP